MSTGVQLWGGPRDGEFVAIPDNRREVKYLIAPQFQPTMIQSMESEQPTPLTPMMCHLYTSATLITADSRTKQIMRYRGEHPA